MPTHCRFAHARQVISEACKLAAPSRCLLLDVGANAGCAFSRSAGGGLASSTSARGLGSPLSRLHWDSPRRCHVCTRPGSALSSSAGGCERAGCGPLWWASWGGEVRAAFWRYCPTSSSNSMCGPICPLAPPPLPLLLPSLPSCSLSHTRYNVWRMTGASSHCSLQVIAFEPNTREFGLLTANVHASGTQAHTTLLQKAVRPPAHADLIPTHRAMYNVRHARCCDGR